MNDYEKAIQENGFTIVDGVKYAIGDQPQIDNWSEGVAYKAYGFTKAMLDEKGKHDPLFDEHKELIWDCTDWHNSETDEEFDCDWENNAIINE